MNIEVLVIIFVAVVLTGCGARGSSNQSKLPLDGPIPSSQKSAPEAPRPAYGFPLDVEIDVPDVPKEIQGPSPPIPQGTPKPGGLLAPTE